MSFKNLDNQHPEYRTYYETLIKRLQINESKKSIFSDKWNNLPTDKWLQNQYCTIFPNKKSCRQFMNEISLGYFNGKKMKQYKILKHPKGFVIMTYGMWQWQKVLNPDFNNIGTITALQIEKDCYTLDTY